MSVLSWLFPQPAPISAAPIKQPVLTSAVIPGDMTASQRVIDLIISFEGLAALDKSNGRYYPYLCPAGYWTIGAGHVVLLDNVMLHGAENRQKAFGVYPNGLSRDDCMNLLKDDLARFEAGLNTVVHGYPTTQNEFDAMLSMSFNVGMGALETSSVLRFHKAGKKTSRLPESIAVADYAMKHMTTDNAPDSFLLFDESGGRILNGLVNRREAERDLYMAA